MKRFTILSLCILQVILSVHAEGHYTVIGPGTLHSARKYNVAVSVHHTNEPCQLKVGITGPLYNETKLVDLEANVVKHVEFDVPALKEGDYNLTAEGVSGVIFQNTTKLNYADFTPYMRIQTDKGAYKPGDELNFRVLFLDENLKPAEVPKETVIWLEDGKRNRIKEFKNIKATKGVYTGKIEISEFPVLGNWRLSVAAGSTYPEQVFFDVSKYVLPKYTVKVESTDRVSVRDGDMQVVVRANYTYGEPVDAKVTLVMNLNTFQYYGENEKKLEPPPTLIKTTDMVRGKAKFDLNVKDYAAFLASKTSSAYISVTATVEEHFTGVKINGSSSTTLYPYRYEMHCLGYETCSQFKVNEEGEVAIAIKLVDDTPLKDTKSVVKLVYTEAVSKTYWSGQYENKTEPAEPKITEEKYEFESHLNDTSVAVFKVKLPELADFEGYSHFYTMEVFYLDETRKLFNTYQYKKPDYVNPDPYEEPKDYFKIHTNYADNRYHLNLTEKAIITVNSSEPLSYFIYTIVARGNILQSEYVALADQPKVYNFTVIPNFLMSPYCNIYAYYINSVGNLTFAETSISIDVELQNKLEITAPEKVKPGEEVALRIKTTPNSFVGLLAVDQSVLLLNGNNDITPNEFGWRLGIFNTQTPWQGGYTQYPGDRSGLVTLTNANYFYNKTAPYHHAVGFAGADGHVSTTRPAGAPGPPGATNFIGAKPAVIESKPSVDNIAVRKDFSETWIFADIENTATEEFTWAKKIPDTITSWVVTGFSLNPIKGLGVTKEASKIITFQPFFVAIRLPYSVKRGEVINVPALVFNYLDKDLDVELTLDNTDGEFEFTEVSNEVIDTPKRTETLSVPANTARGVSFIIRPKIVGNIMLKFTAISPIAGDAVHKTLKVVPEGVTEYANRAYFINLKDKPEFKETFELQLPSEVVPDSEHIEFSVIGDLLGPILNNLNNLVRMPVGCGEQTVSTMVPNIMVLRYLKAIGKLTPALEHKLKSNLEHGYQHILSYRHTDGSFSSFGPSSDESKPRNGSTWLTAYVVRSLKQAKEFIDVDDQILSDGLSYLHSTQASNGSFIENGDYFYHSQKDHLRLTASAVLAFQEYGNYSSNFQTTVDNGYKYILDNWEQTTDLVAKAFATYTLHTAKHAKAVDFIKNLKSLAKTEDDRMWWSFTKEYPSDFIWWRWRFSNDVELTSYILLVLLDQEGETIDTVLPIIKWLVAQRNSYGGFSSTQDTVVGLHALTQFATKFGYESGVMDIDFATKGGVEKKDTVKVTEDNGLLMQINELPAKTRSVDFSAKGKGAALVQVSYQYNIFEKEKQPAFTINNVVNKETPAHKLELDVCVEYSGKGDSSNMAVLEVSLPSGYVADVESFERIKKVERVRQTETKNGDTVIVVYFESLHKTEMQCIPIEAFKSFAVALQKPAAVVVYDYYDTNEKATSYYEISSKLCDLCEEDEECKKKC